MKVPDEILHDLRNLVNELRLSFDDKTIKQIQKEVGKTADMVEDLILKGEVE